MLETGYSWKYIGETLETNISTIANCLKRLIGKEKYEEIYNKYTENERKEITEEFERPAIIEKLKSLNLLFEQQYPILTYEEMNENKLTNEIINEIKTNEIGIKALSEKYNIDQKIIKRIIILN